MVWYACTMAGSPQSVSLLNHLIKLFEFSAVLDKHCHFTCHHMNSVLSYARKPFFKGISMSVSL